MVAIILLISFFYPLVILWPTLYFPMEVLDLTYIVGQYLGLAAYLLLFFQYVGTLKVKFLEKVAPYDLRIKKHRILGYLSLFTILFHPVALLAYYFLNKIPFEINIYSFLGTISTIIIVLIAVSSFFYRKFKFKYETWKKIHWSSFLVFPFVYYHSINIGSSMYGIHREIWIVIFTLYIVIVIYKVIFELYKLKKTYTVFEVIHENKDVTTLKIKAHKEFIPGQFGFISIKDEGKWLSWHPFSISAPVDRGYFSFTIKNLGDFTSKIKNVKPGDKIKLNLPYGGFTLENSDERLIFIAGGVGITPIHSIISSLAQDGKDKEVLLLYSVKHEDEILFRSEFDAIFEGKANWGLKYIVSYQEDWDGLKGFITPQNLKDLCNGNFNGTFYLCGPKPMVAPLKKFLLKKKVGKKRIRFEEFMFLP